MIGQGASDMTQCICEFVSSVWVNLRGHWLGYSQADQRCVQQELVIDQFNTRMVQLELQDRRCIGEARRHRATGAKALFRSSMLEHRRLQGQMAQLQRFKENAMAQFDALSNHELNRTFVRAMKGMVGVSKDRVTVTREDAETVMEDLHDSLSQVKDLTDFLGQPISGADEADDTELENEFIEETRAEPVALDEAIVAVPVGGSPVAPYTNSRIEDLLSVRQMLPST